MPNRDAKFEHFCRDLDVYLSEADRVVFDIPEEALEGTGPESLTLLKKTQIKVGREVHKLVESGGQQERLLNLYVIDQALYKLHHKINNAEDAVANDLCRDIQRVLNHRLKKIDEKRALAEHRFRKRVKWNERMRVVCYLISMVCAVAGFSYPADAVFYLSIVLLCFTQIFLLGNIWISGEEKKRDAVFQANDPEVVKSALKFLSAERLVILLEPPSFAPEYLERFFKMLVSLALSFGWIPKAAVDIEDVIENGKAALADAYSAHPATFDGEFIREWREEFEKIQLSLRHRFGDSLYSFNQSEHSDPFFYLKQYALLRREEFGGDVRRFLKRTEFL